MFEKIGKGILLAIGILMIMSVTVWDPATITEKAKRWFGLRTGPRAGLEGMTPTTGREAVERQENQEIRRLVEGLSIADTRETIATLSGLPSRVAGYPGNEMAAEYVEDQFRAIGLHNVRSQEVRVTVPVDLGGQMTVEGLDGAVELFALWPNEVRTSSLPEGFHGTLLDGGKGEFESFNGRRMNRTEENTLEVRGENR
jgi:hypothetical protein